MKYLISVAMTPEVVIFVPERRINSPMPDRSTAPSKPIAFSARSIKLAKQTGGEPSDNQNNCRSEKRGQKINETHERVRQ